MKIDSYSFGTITIKGVTYEEDVIILPDKVIPGWRRENGHYLSTADLEDIIERKPDILVVGTGAYGKMDVPDTIRRELGQIGIEVFSAFTGEACKNLNKYFEEGRNAAGVLHLTC